VDACLAAMRVERRGADWKVRAEGSALLATERRELALTPLSRRGRRREAACRWNLLVDFSIAARINICCLYIVRGEGNEQSR
jgi:hypothetical protein